MPRVNTGACGEQKVHKIDFAPRGGVRQRRRAMFVFLIHVGSSLQEKAHDIGVPPGCRLPQRPSVDFSAMEQQKPNDIDMAAGCGPA
jgi:hypothetical protein